MPVMAPGEPSGGLGRGKGHWRRGGRGGFCSCFLPWQVPQPSPHFQDTQAGEVGPKEGSSVLPSRVPGADVYLHPGRKGRFWLGLGVGGGLGDGDVGLRRFAGREGGAGGGCCERLGRGVETSLASRGWRLSSWESPQGGSRKVAEVMRTQSAHTGESLLSEASGFPDLSSPAAGTGSGLPAGQRLPAHQGDWQELLDL